MSASKPANAPRSNVLGSGTTAVNPISSKAIKSLLDALAWLIVMAMLPMLLLRVWLATEKPK